jgi:hypothetical protein
MSDTFFLAASSIIQLVFMMKKMVFSILQEVQQEPQIIVVSDLSDLLMTATANSDKPLAQALQDDFSFYCITCGENHGYCNTIDGRECFKNNIQEMKHATRCNA